MQLTSVGYGIVARALLLPDDFDDESALLWIECDQLVAGRDIRKVHNSDFSSSALDHLSNIDTSLGRLGIICQTNQVRVVNANCPNTLDSNSQLSDEQIVKGW
ncbi:MAG: hypothetical protein NTZ65_00245 [Candidatus Berkelbacteria bacterium]|nr:hypothetical protein [Candidatus Berkelbacteria bacterium]